MYANLSSRNTDEYYSRLAFIASIVGHLGLLFVLIYKPLPAKRKPAIIYSVTVEAGATKGGLTQIPDPKNKSAVVAPKKVSQEEQKQPEVKEPVKKAEEKPVKPVEKPEVIIPDEKKQPVVPKKVEQPTEKKKVEEKPKVVEQKQKPKETPKTTPPKQVIPDANQNYQKAMQRYLGASTDAGGTGFGAAGTGSGKGIGGGVLRSPEWFRYKALLETHVKRAWNWHDPRATLAARVRFQISPTGEVSNVRITESSGNSAYDDAALRCVSRASPVPVATPDIYPDFKDVEILFTP